MSTLQKKAQGPLLLRCHRLMDAFAKSDDERDFYIDRIEGFIIYVDLDKSNDEIVALEKDIEKNKERYLMIPKMSFYEGKKIMENFVHEKVYDIDTKEKLLDIIQSKEAREHFIEFIYDHLHELEKWQQFYQERSRIRIIEWLRSNNFHFVFEEDLEMTTSLIEKLKRNLFEAKVPKEIEVARKAMIAKAKTYYSNEALNPRPKRGRPPKQQLKLEIEPHVTTDIFVTVPNAARPFLYTPEISSASDITFSAKFESKEALMANKKTINGHGFGESIESINAKLATLRELSSKWMDKDEDEDLEEDDFFDDDEEDEDEEFEEKPKKVKKSPPPAKKPAVKAKNAEKPKTPLRKITPPKKTKKAAPVKKKPVKPKVKLRTIKKSDSKKR